VIYVDEAYFTEISPLSRQLIKSAREAGMFTMTSGEEGRKERERKREGEGEAGQEVEKEVKEEATRGSREG
jgi:hypothetical protein